MSTHIFGSHFVHKNIHSRYNNASIISVFKYAPVTSVDTERSFSKLKTILTDNRQKLTQEDLKKLLIINFNCDK